MARCDALTGMRPGRNYASVSLIDAVQCRKEGVVPSPTGPVCRGHHNAGFVSWSQTIGAVSETLGLAERFAEKMRAVVEGDPR